MLVLEAAGFDVVIVETVGVGQNEIAVSEMVDTFLLLTLARAGDQPQGIKRGILELADVIAVNKADGDGETPAKAAARDLMGAMRLMLPGRDVRRPPVLTCSALTGAGLDEVWEAVLEHRAYLEEHHSLATRRAQQQEDWMWAMVEDRLAELGLSVPDVAKPVASYVPAVSSGAQVFTSGQLPTQAGELLATGKVGGEVTPERAAECARQSALNAIAAVKAEIGDLSRVRRVVKVVAFVASTPDFTGQPGVANGASELLGKAFGDAGVHARSAVAAPVLPLDAPVEVEILVEVD